MVPPYIILQIKIAWDFCVLFGTTGALKFGIIITINSHQMSKCTKNDVSYISYLTSQSMKLFSSNICYSALGM